MSLAHAAALPSASASARRSAACLIAVSMLLWTLIETLGQYYTRRISAPQVVWTRYGTHLLFMFAFRFPRKGLGMIQTKHMGMQIGRGLLMLLMPAAYLFSFTYFELNDIWAAFWVEPLFLIAGGYWLLRERCNPRYLGLTLLGFLGAMMIMKPTSALLSPALILPLLMAASYAGYILLTRKMIDEPIDTKLFYTAASVFVPLTLLIPFVWVTPAPRDWLLLISIGIAGYFLLLCLELAVDRAPVSYLAPFVFIRIVWGVLAEFIFVGKVPGEWSIAGLFLVITTIVLHYAWSSRDLNPVKEVRA